MTENGDPHENALAERVNGILKNEWLSLEQFHNFEQAKDRIDQVVKIYNEIRPHLSCGMKKRRAFLSGKAGLIITRFVRS